ncbi:MAG: C-mannosyltransferase dpy-19 family protein [Verrucomicrobia bacterium]|nr:C-mannosyltransferase dpy-19 family protein [Verrucomicrobiota bacterium]
MLLRKNILLIAGLLFLFALGVGIRVAVLEKQYEIVGDDLPFTMESALQFRMVEQVALVGGLPAVDKKVQYPDGIDVKSSYTVGAEYFYGTLSRLLPRFLSLEERIRWVECLWFCTGIIYIALWIGLWQKGIWAGTIAGLFYAVSLISVMRSTGQELSRENFALPFLLGHFALNAAAWRTRNVRGRLMATIGSAVFLGLALCSWDLIQFYVALWMLVSAVSLVRTSCDREWKQSWLLHWVILVVCGIVNPYLRAHGFLSSPVMLLSYGVALVLWSNRRGGVRHVWRSAALIMFPVVVSFLLPSDYGSSYGHFAQLLTAKLRFVNQKPVDPSLLTFTQKIMWVPALHSSSWPLTWMLAPFILPLTLIAVCAAVYELKVRRQRELTRLTIFCVTSLIAFTLFVRFHVFLAIFASGLMGWLASWALDKRLLARIAVTGLLIAGVSGEAVHVVKQPEMWGRAGVYYAELDNLVEWLDDHVAPEPVLANFGVSGSILAYGRCPIVLHPKFENEEIRRRVEAYGEQLFKGSEKGFRDWADQFGARYYVYSMGEFAGRGEQEQMRYFVDALEPPETAPARLFEKRPQDGRYFRYLWGNRKYRVFKMLTISDEKLAQAYAREAEIFFERGDLAGAEEQASAALRIDPLQEAGGAVLKHVISLKARGFDYDTGEIDEP